MLQAGDPAPDFDCPALIAGVRTRFHLRQALQESRILLCFHPNNWDWITAAQLVEFQAHRARFRAANLETVAVTVDSVMNSVAWERQIGPFDFPWCADFWPHGEISRSYGVLRQEEPDRGASERSFFFVSRLQTVEFSQLHAAEQLLEIEEVMRIIRHLRG